MAKIFEFATLELRPGVDEQEFVKFFIENYLPLGPRLGWKGYLLKADRGERAGKFAAITEIPSVESRHRFMPKTTGEFTEEGLRLLGPEFDELNKKLDKYVTDFPMTDYIEQGK